MKLIYIHLTACLFFSTMGLFGQALKTIQVATSKDKGLQVKNFNGFQQPGYDMPLISLRINGTYHSSLKAEKVDDKTALVNGKLALSFQDFAPLKSGGLFSQVILKNTSKDTLTVSNIVPFGESDKHVYLTSWNKGDRQTRTFIFRPGYAPANVTLPDNSWNLGLGIVNVDNGSSVVAITKIDRAKSSNVSLRRFESVIYPGGTLVSNLWLDSYIGRWQEGFRLMFQQNKLYDIEPGTFDNSLYEREDLQWVKYGFVGHFIFAWHSYFYDVEKNTYTYPAFEKKTQDLYGGDNTVVLWSGFPVLGLDQRNQWDLMRVLPGGVNKIRDISDKALARGTRIMTNYKPWDLPAAYDQIYNSTRYEDPIEGLGHISQEAGFHGVMFDTRSESSRKFQNDIDKYKKGFGVFPEGMAVPADMQNCMIGRTHGAIEYAPFLNLNKLIKPDFAIYRQIIVEKDYPRRDVALAFFGGHGVEYHQYMNTDLDWVKDLYAFTGKTVHILRENADNFFTPQWTPLLPTTTDSIYVNEWPLEDKTLYTLYSLRPEGYKGYLFEVSPREGFHYVNLWSNREARLKQIGGKYLVEANINPFPTKYLGTRAESQVSAIACFRRQISVEENKDIYKISSPEGKMLRIWQGTPQYGKKPILEVVSGMTELKRSKLRENNFQGDIVIQLFDNDTLADQYTIEGKEGKINDESIGNFDKSKGEASYDGTFMNISLLHEKDLLNITQKKDAEITVYLKDMKAYPALRSKDKNIEIKLLDTFGRYEGDFVVLAKQNGSVVDSANVNMPYGYARLTSKIETTPTARSAPESMILIPAGKFTFKAKHIGDWIVKHPVEDTAKVFSMKSFYMDKHPVTNAQFKKFMDETNYRPTDSENFLKHWESDKISPEDVDKPVTYVSYEDAKAYAKWAKKRLPTEKEWQYAAQGEKGQLYPWGNQLDSLKCNTANGILDPIGKYPQGANNLGIEELTGSVWQMTNDLYKNATVSFIILKGGSYFTPRSSWWYVTGGALPLTCRQQLLRVSQGYERNATTGFRLVKDAQD